jgi:hypothetical protein
VDTGGTVVAYTSYFNKQRHACLVEISSKRSNDGSVYDQTFNPKDGAFIASRTRPAGVQPMDDGVIDDVAPIPVQQRRAALSWFRDLRTR